MSPATAANLCLSQQDVLDFHQQGFLGPFRLWEERETADIQKMLEGFYLDQPDDSVPSNNRFLRHPEIIDLVRRPALVDRMRCILGDDLFLWRIGAFIKEANAGIGLKEVPWHQDHNYWPIEPALVCSAWLAVDDVDEENSAVHIIPKSHREMIPHIPGTEEQYLHEQADPKYFDARQKIPMKCRAGEFFLFNERLLHWSKPNTSDRRRFGLAIRVLPPQVRVLDYDCDEHALAQLHGADPLQFNRILGDTSE